MSQSRQTPRIDALLRRLRGRIVMMIWLHGVGSVAAVAGLVLLLHFLIDWSLHVPAAVRLLHTAALVVLPLVVLFRELVQRLRRVPDRAELALIAERADSDAHQLLVSAVQLAPALEGPARPSTSLVRRVVARAEARADAVPVHEVVDARGPARRWALGGLSVAAAIFVLLRSGELGSIFFQRMLGRDVPWPRRTHLSLEIPEVGSGLQVLEAGAERIHVRLARGGDVPLVVRAQGVVPDEITLHFSNAPSSVLPSAGSDLFRTRLRALQEDVSFWVTGGDDRRGLPRVEVEVLQPPDVAGLALLITPPAYTGLPERVVHDRDVEVLQGSQLSVHVLPDPPGATGRVRLVPADRVIELEAAPFPRPPAEAPDGGPDGPADVPGLAFRMLAQESFRYRFELVDETGLENPDPGLYGVRVDEDRRPEVTLVAPGRAEINVVAGGTLPLRVRVSDDFGVADLGWTVQRSGAETELARGALRISPLNPTPADDSASPAAPLEGMAWRRMEVAELFGTGAPEEGSQLVLQVEAVDNREPQANRSPSPPVRVHVVGSDEFMRRLQDDLARVGEAARRTADLVDLKLLRTRELVQAMASDELDAVGATEISAAQSSARRIEGDARALGRELAAITQSLLDSRLDPRSGGLLEALDAGLSSSTDKSFRPDAWRELAGRHSRGELGRAELATELVDMVGIALDVSELHAASASAAMDRARAAGGPLARREALAEAELHQGRAKERLDDLLAALSEWDDFQSVLGNLRDILNGQKNLMERTRQFAKEN